MVTFTVAITSAGITSAAALSVPLGSHGPLFVLLATVSAAVRMAP
ncbi:hypothetical protein [Streptomyces sp. NPDC057336]